MIDYAAVISELRSKLGEGVLGVDGEGDSTVVRVGPAAAHPALERLKAAGFNMLADLTAVDHSAWGEAPRPPTGERPATKLGGERFEIVYRLLSLDAEKDLERERLLVSARLRDGEPVPRSARDLWPAADWLEREVWDMFGMPFADRPGIKRLLLYEEFQGHALRKDYPIAKRQPLVGPPSGERPDNPSFNRDFPAVAPDDD